MASLSEKEFKYLKDRDFLLTKQEIHLKVTEVLSDTEVRLKETIRQVDFPFPDQTFLKAGKISKGEQYRGLPYWVLDYPRKFGKEDVFSFRTMVWWGNEISCCLHLAGADLHAFRDQVLQRYRQDANQFISVATTPWEYHFHSDNYRKATELSDAEVDGHMQATNFIKLAYQLPLDQIQELPDFATHTFIKILNSLQ